MVEYEALSLDYCYACDQDEPWPDTGVYMWCMECNHRYLTAQDLVNAHTELIEELNAEHPGLKPKTSADDIYACPLCAHDF